MALEESPATQCLQNNTLASACCRSHSGRERRRGGQRHGGSPKIKNQVSVALKADINLSLQCITGIYQRSRKEGDHDNFLGRSQSCHPAGVIFTRHFTDIHYDQFHPQVSGLLILFIFLRFIILCTNAPL